MDEKEWDVIRFFIGDEIDTFFEEKKFYKESGIIVIEKKDLDELYFKIRERVERQFGLVKED